jgi:hypothetical protein
MPQRYGLAPSSLDARRVSIRSSRPSIADSREVSSEETSFTKDADMVAASTPVRPIPSTINTLATARPAGVIGISVP